MNYIPKHLHKTKGLFMKQSCSKAGIIQQLDMLGVAWIQKALGTGGGMRLWPSPPSPPVVPELDFDFVFVIYCKTNLLSRTRHAL